MNTKKSKYSSEDVMSHKIRLDNFWYNCISPEDKDLTEDDIKVKDKFLDLVHDFFKEELNIKIN